MNFIKKKHNKLVVKNLQKFEKVMDKMTRMQMKINKESAAAMLLYFELMNRIGIPQTQDRYDMYQDCLKNCQEVIDDFQKQLNRHKMLIIASDFHKQSSENPNIEN